MEGSQRGLITIFGDINARCLSAFGLSARPPSLLVSTIDRQAEISLVVQQNTSGAFLPDPEIVHALVDEVFETVFKFWPILPRKAFDEAYSILYGSKPYGENKISWNHLALIYSVLSLGQYVHSRKAIPVIQDNTIIVDHGTLWFQQSVTLVPPTQSKQSCTAVQTTLCHVLYLLLSGSVDQSDRFLEHAVQALSTMQLHQVLSTSDEAHKLDFERRTYLGCQLLDSYIAMLRGRPCLLPVLTVSKSLLRSDDIEAVTILCSELRATDLLNNSQGRGESSLDTVSSALVPEGASSDEQRQLDAVDVLLHNPLKESNDDDVFGKTQTIAHARLQETYGRARMVLYYPYLVHLLQPELARLSQGSPMNGQRCVEAADAAMEAALYLAYHNRLPACAAQVIAFAATALLTFEVARACGTFQFASFRPRHDARAAFELLAGICLFHPDTTEYITAMMTVIDRIAIDSQA